ncbi:MAG TPA: hypothetical protein VGC03_07270 [Acidimicrobiia bacterium]
MSERQRLSAWAGPVAGVVAVVALVIVGLARGPAEFDPGSPEGTIQLYITALVDGDFDTAASLWDESGCIPISSIPSGGSPDASASLVRVEGNDIEATVVVRLTESSRDPLGGLYDYEEWFTLIRRGDSWRIRQLSWPYYDLPCEESP